jgi:CRP-like cAMP-binding protein
MANKVKQQFVKFQKTLDSLDPTQKQYLNVKASLFKEIPFGGTSFGELSLQLEKPRQATVFVKSKNASLIVLSKHNYKRVLDSDLRQQNELAVAKIRQFELFKQITKLKLNNLRYYFHEKSIKRGSYLYRQGDSINGVFCILSGEA